MYARIDKLSAALVGAPSVGGCGLGAVSAGQEQGQLGLGA